ncbi:hypothetical protein PFISCL1PPCAC_3560, partial [Pristionchus fissidentatus]
VGCLPVLPIQEFDTFIPFGREAKIFEMNQKCERLSNKTAIITITHNPKDALDFAKIFSKTGKVGNTCYFNGKEVAEGHAVRVGKMTLACVYKDNHFEV